MGLPCLGGAGQGEGHAFFYCEMGTKLHYSECLISAVNCVAANFRNYFVGTVCNVCAMLPG